jgi:F-type H+-transporting ATPase subunit b
MDKILHQLSDLMLGSIPTMVLFVLLIVAYSILVRGPLDKVLAERRKRTTGAVEQARGALSAAEAETAVFEDKLRAARAEIFAMRDQKIKQANAERDRALAEARSATNERISVARQGIEQNVAAARQQIEAMSGELSAQILRAVLPAGVVETGAAQ